MPPSSDRESPSIPTSIIGSLTQKQAQKPSDPTANIPSKKEKRNGAAKDVSSAGAAVTKAASKMPDGPKPAISPITSETSSPQTKPVPVISNGKHITSPLLGALPSNAFNTNQSTTEWAKNVPAFSSSPGNLISLSDSPPTQPSSYDDRSTLAGWSQRERIPANSQLPSVSPPYYRPRRPQSFQLDGQPLSDDPSSPRPSNMFRRSSVYSQQSQRYPLHPPPPHQPQPHFYGAPELDLGLGPHAQGLKPGSHGYYCGFDSLQTSRRGGQSYVENVVISSHEGALDIFGINKSGLDRIATLDGLRGGVYHAKILPWDVEPDAHAVHDIFPLIALVVHGPVLPTTDAYSETARPSAETRAESVRSSPRGYPIAPGESNLGSITHYQTTVEVYSLKLRKHVATLLSLPQTPLTVPVTSSLFVRPPPLGALTISADAGNVLITSGSSGEIWVYQQSSIGNDLRSNFTFIGKFWTTLHYSTVQDAQRLSEPAESERSGKEAWTVNQSKTPLFALRGRWLAYSPSSTTSQISLKAVVPNLSSTSRILGANTFAPPQPPSVNCAVDMPEGDEFWGRLRRQAAQEAIKGAKWIGDQGARAWNNYWNKQSSPPAPNSGPWSSPTQKQELEFPPTHGAEVTPPSNLDPTLISIIDLNKLATLRTDPSAGNHVLATFKAPFGCSYVSFSPSGLSLFTASSKGDVQFVWDLMRIQYTRSSAFQLQNPAVIQVQHVRQIAIFTRLTIARIVDVVWTAPQGESIAMITERNTVHFLDLPPSAFVWPPYRRRIKSSSRRVSQALGESEVPATATELASNAVSAVWNFAQPFMTRPRGFSGPNAAGSIAASITATAGQGGKALASTISKSFGAATGTIENFRKSGEHRLHLPQGSMPITKNSIRWLGPPFKDSFAALIDGTVMIYTTKHIQPKSQGERQRFYISTKHQDHRLPPIPDYNIAPAASRASDVEEDLDLTEKEHEATPSNIKRISVLRTDPSAGTESSIPQSEIESNAPYQPFHTDRRISLQVYSVAADSPPSPSVSTLLSPATIQTPSKPTTGSPWVFGRPINTIKLDVGPGQLDEEDLHSLDEHRPLPISAMERVTTKISEPDEEVEQIVVTTRRRRGPIDQPGDEEGFFEDDCEVLDYANQRV